MLSGTHRDLLFGSKSRCFACKSRRLGLGPIETSNSDARQAVFHAGNHGWFLGPIQTCNFCPKCTGLDAKTSDEGWVWWRLVFHVLKSLFCMHKTAGEGWNPYRLFILVLSTLLCVLKTIEEVWEPYRIVSLFIKSLFWMKKNTDGGWNPYRIVILVHKSLFCIKNRTLGLGPIETSNSSANRTLLHAQNDWSCLGPIGTCNLLQKLLFCTQKPQIRVGTHRGKLFWYLSRCIACTKRQVMTGTHRHSLFGSKTRWFACNKHRWGLEPIETSNSDSRHTVLNAENH